jgi:hypothetical protein
VILADISVFATLLSEPDFNAAAFDPSKPAFTCAGPGAWLFAGIKT